MSNWHYANKVPTDPWRSAMTIPRELSLRGDHLVQTPIKPPDGFPEVSFTTKNGSVRILENDQRYVEIGVRNKKLFVDTSRAWNEIDAPTLQEIEIGDHAIDIRVIADRSSIEVFANKGAISVTNLVWIDTAFGAVQAMGELSALTVNQLTLRA